MFKLTHNALVLLATAALMPLSLAAGVSGLKKQFESGEQQASTLTAAKTEPGKLGKRFAHLNIPVRNTQDAPKELAAALAKRKEEAQKVATTAASPADEQDKWAEVDQLLTESTSIVSEMEKTHKELLYIDGFFTTQPTNKKSEVSVDPLDLPEIDISHTSTATESALTQRKNLRGQEGRRAPTRTPRTKAAEKTEGSAEGK